MINITKYSSKNMDVNSYVLAKDGKALIIDPGFNGEKILLHCQNHQLMIEMIVLTHGHYDHIKDLAMLIDKRPRIFIHQDEKAFLYDPNLNLSSMFRENLVFDQNYELQLLEDGETVNFASEKLKIVHLPGHTKGSIGIIYNQHFFSGDTLFFDSIGRTDLPTGNHVKIFTSLNKIKKTFSMNTIVYPGHGKGGKLKEIMLINPYLNK